MRCKDYNPANRYWMKVDELIQRHDKILSKIATLKSSTDSSPSTQDKNENEAAVQDKNHDVATVTPNKKTVVID